MDKLSKGTVFQFEAPNGVPVIAVCVGLIREFQEFTDIDGCVRLFLCYGQNRLFQWQEVELEGELIDSKMGDTLVSYAILPDYDIALRDFTAEGEV